MQTSKDAKKLLHHIDPRLGVRQVEKSYADKCVIYDVDNPEDPWHNVRDKMDAFVAVHFFGWFFKVTRRNTPSAHYEHCRTLPNLMTNQEAASFEWLLSDWFV